jgi:ankyrin repeat protein
MKALLLYKENLFKICCSWLSENNGGKIMSWYEEERKKLLEEHKSGKVSAKRLNEKLDSLDRFINKVDDVKNIRSLKRVTVISIAIILIAVASFFMFREAYVGLSRKTVEISTQPNADPEPAIVGISDSEFVELCKNGSLQQINDAIEYRANVNARDRGWTPLMAAARENPDPEVIAVLIKAGADVNAANISGRTPLILAAGNSPNIDVIKILIDKGADVNPKTEGNTPLMAAAIDNTNPEAITALVNAGADVNATNSLGRTPLLLAAKNNSNPEVVKALINAGADVSINDVDGKTPLIMAMDNANPSPESITALINAGVDVSERDKFGLTPLMLAAANENSTQEVIAAIVKTEPSNNKARVNINAQDENGKTPLIEAAQNNSNPKVISTLLQLGASSTVKDDLGKTAIDYARENRRLKDVDIMQQLQNKEFAIQIKASNLKRATISDYSFLELCKNGTLKQINNAIKNGANVNASNSTGETALMLAAGFNTNQEIIKALMNAGADINAKNVQGSTVNDYLRRNELLKTSGFQSPGQMIPIRRGSTVDRAGDAKFIDLCLKGGSLTQIRDAVVNGANVNARSQYSRTTPLMAVVSSKTPRQEAIRILISAGADVNAVDDLGRSALILAAKFGSNPELLNALLNVGANAKLVDRTGRMAINYALENKNMRNTPALRRLANDSDYRVP